MNNINWNLEMENRIKKIPESEKPKLLLHVCCAPCSSHCLEILAEHFDITIYFYNPNIFPENEYDHRAGEIKKILKGMKLENKIKSVICKYDPNEFYTVASGYENEPEGGARCVECFKLRLENTAKYAKNNGFDLFTTSLTISPHKNARILNKLGLEIAKKHDVEYLPADFKKKNGYKRSIELSKQFDLYRQEYCGCKFSLENSEPKKSNNKE